MTDRSLDHMAEQLRRLAFRLGEPEPGVDVRLAEAVLELFETGVDLVEFISCATACPARPA